MPQSLHAILLHGHTVIQNMDLPIGMYSEEAQESMNKLFKKFRQNFSRKSSRCDSNKDLLYRLLCSSDPVISSLRNPQTKNKVKMFTADVLELLEPNSQIISNENSL